MKKITFGKSEEELGNWGKEKRIGINEICPKFLFFTQFDYTMIIIIMKIHFTQIPVIFWFFLLPSSSKQTKQITKIPIFGNDKSFFTRDIFSFRGRRNENIVIF